MTREEFIAAMGFEPENDDLERANCPKRGLMHYGCGVCDHGKPTWACHSCLAARINSRHERSGSR